MLTDILILIAGFILLIKGADYLINGASGLAKKFGVSPLIIGLTIVAFGTSAPELIVNIIASIQGASELTVGNIIGSNVSNIGMIIGIAALIYPLAIKESTVKKEIPMMLLAAIIMIALVADRVSKIDEVDLLSRNDGIALVLVFGIFLYYLFSQIRKQTRKKSVNAEFREEYPTEKSSITKLALITLGGLVAILVGGQLTVGSAVDIATALGVSQVLIGITVIAIGTSLPELTTAVVAALKKHPDIAVGGIVGSNIFNTLLVLGISAIIRPIPFQTQWYTDLGIMLLFSLAMLVFSITHKKLIKRWEGGVLLAAYIAYITFTIIRG